MSLLNTNIISVNISSIDPILRPPLILQHFHFVELSLQAPPPQAGLTLL